MTQILKNILTERDNQTFELISVLTLLAMTGLVVYAGYDLIHNNARFDPETYGIGVATILGGSGLGRFLKKDTEHSGGPTPSSGP
jgi:TRAP-type C4-dicarboxylate transport system permease small subunit